MKLSYDGNTLYDNWGQIMAQVIPTPEGTYTVRMPAVAFTAADKTTAWEDVHDILVGRVKMWASSAKVILSGPSSCILTGSIFHVRVELGEYTAKVYPGVLGSGVAVPFDVPNGQDLVTAIQDHLILEIRNATGVDPVAPYPLDDAVISEERLALRMMRRSRRTPNG